MSQRKIPFRQLDITKSDLGLGNVDNTSDLNKPISTATQTALNLKADSSAVTSALALKADDNAVVHLAGTETISGQKTFSGAGSYTPVSNLVQNFGSSTRYFANTYARRMNLNASAYFDGTTAGEIATTGVLRATSAVLTTPAISSPTGLTKTDVGLSNVDNTSNATERTAAAYLQNKDLSHPSNTFANKASVASGATVAPTGWAAFNEQYITAQAVNLTIDAPATAYINGNKLLIRIKDNGTARTIAWNAIYRAIGVILPTSTVVGATTYVYATYNSADSKWDVLSVGVGA